MIAESNEIRSNLCMLIKLQLALVVIKVRIDMSRSWGFDCKWNSYKYGEFHGNAVEYTRFVEPRE